MRTVQNIESQNWLITPAAPAVNERPPSSVNGQKWLLTLTGVALVDLKGASGSWLRETVDVYPDLKGAMNHAISRHSVPRPPGAEGRDYNTAFQVEQWAPFASLGSVFDQDQSVNAGFAVDRWRPAPFGSGKDVVTGESLGNLFAAIRVDVAVRDIDAWLHRVNYHISLLGRIRFLPHEVL